MDDMERYGDYNEVDEPPRKSPVLLTIKIIAFVIIFSVVGLLAIRLVMFNYYPKSMKTVYFNDTLTSFYNERDGEIGAKTQKLKAPYDDEEEGNFLCDHLILVPELGQLQITVRYNNSLLNKLAAELSLTSEQLMDEELLSFRLSGLDFEVEGSTQLVETPSAVKREKVGMYTYFKVVFDGVELGKDAAGDWTVLEIFVKGQTSSEPYAKVLVYDRTEQYYSIKDYNLSGGEEPK